ncbi:MAG: PAS domain S-box protein [Nitrospirae bacterium]|nr:PAS domain S-box protein [Nitrospirota bacterium]
MGRANKPGGKKRPKASRGRSALKHSDEQFQRAQEASRESEERLAKINECFLHFGTNPDENINRLTALCGELLGATCALYSRLYGDMLCSLGQWHTPPGFNPVEKPEGHLCYDIIQRSEDRLLVVRNLPQTPYAQTDPTVTRCQLQTYIGQAVKCGGTAVGSLYTMFRRDFVPSEADEKLMGLLASAISVEEERKAALETLRRSEEKFRQLVETTRDWVWEVNEDAVYTYASPRIHQILGYAPEEVLGKTPFDLMPPEEAQRVAEIFHHIADARQPFLLLENTTRHRDGHLVVLEISGAPIFDDQGVFRGYRGIARDITERKRAEEAFRRSEEQLRHSQKMEAIGRLSSGIAHDFSNLLMAITGYCDMLLARLGQADPLREPVQEIKKISESGSELNRQLLVFSRKQAQQPVELNLNSVVSPMSKMLRRLIGEHIELVTTLDPSLEWVKADRGQLEQVIVNLAVNARDAMPEAGTLTIETANVDLDQSAAEELLFTKDGRCVMLAVHDTGVGMDPETQTHCFEPFFTTKGQEKGTGLGLSTVYGIVKQHGGHIEVFSGVGRGTVFKIYLPRIDAPVETAPAAEAPVPTASGSETILLAEDERIIRGLVRGMLKMRGYTVLEASQSQEALRICEEHPGPIHLLLTDVVMPGMNGRELAERVVSLRSNTRVLYISGYSYDTIFQHGVFEPGVAFLQKPFSPEALLRKIQEVLTAAPQGS